MAAVLYSGTNGKGDPGKDKSAGQQQAQDTKNQDKENNADRGSATEQREMYDHRKHSG